MATRIIIHAYRDYKEKKRKQKLVPWTDTYADHVQNPVFSRVFTPPHVISRVVYDYCSSTDDATAVQRNVRREWARVYGYQTHVFTRAAFVITFRLHVAR